MSLLPHQQRVVDEKTQLDDRLTKLQAFFGGEIFQTLHEDERNRLRDQEAFMLGYSKVLGERIAAFES